MWHRGYNNKSVLLGHLCATKRMHNGMEKNNENDEDGFVEKDDKS